MSKKKILQYFAYRSNCCFKIYLLSDSLQRTPFSSCPDSGLACFYVLVVIYCTSYEIAKSLFICRILPPTAQ